MGANTKIQWATHTFNPWRGCRKVAPGCENCYAEAQAKRNSATLGVWGPSGTRVVASEAMWRQPVKWDRDAEPESLPIERPRVFCASLADVFEDWNGCVSASDGRFFSKPYLESESQPENWILDYEQSSLSRDPQGWRDVTLDDVRSRLFRLIDSTPNLDWLLLTKRPENVRRMVLDARRTTKTHHHCYRCGETRSNEKGGCESPCLKNVWLGTSIACQYDADRNIPELLKCRDLAEKLFVSIEPLIGPVDIAEWLHDSDCHFREGVCHCAEPRESHIDWVIVGGESGPKSRPCYINWIRSIVRQCKEAGVPCFAKQVGTNAWMDPAELSERRERADYVPLHETKGGDPSEWPEDIRVREVPE